LSKEPDLEESFTERAEKLIDLLARETFFRELPSIDQHAKALEGEYERRFKDASQARKNAYSEALEKLETTPGWEKLSDEQKKVIGEPLTQYVTGSPDTGTGIPQLRSDCDASTNRLNKAVEEMMRLLDGARVVRVNAASFFAGGVESGEQLDSALDGLRAECERHIGAGKKVLIQ